jgi:hypothetical protein
VASLPIIPNTGPSNTLPTLPALASLPAPATSPLCIRDVQIAQHIDFKVSTTGEHLSWWRQIIIFLFTMYKVVDHVTEGAAPAAPSDDWLADDIHISLWFMKTLSNDLLRLVQGTDGRACSTWTKLHNFFYANRSSQYLYLSKLFRNTPHGDMTIAVYAARLQNIADDLANIGYPVADHDLTMQFLAGLGKKFALPRSVISNGGALPSFSDTLSRLLLAEVEIDKEQGEEASQAMVVHDGGHGGSQSVGAGQHAGGQNRGVAQERGGDRGGGPSGGGRGAFPPPGGLPGGISPTYRGKNPIPDYVHGQGRGASQQSGGQ